MKENKVDSVHISKEARIGRPAGVSPEWIPPVLKRFYDYMKNCAKSFNKELKEDREEEFIKVAAKSFKGEI